MKRHEYLYSGIVALITAAALLAAGIIITILLKPVIDAEDLAMKVFLLIPMCFYALAAFFAITGIFALYNDYKIEHGTVIEADITSISEFFLGSSGTSNVRYNLFCETVINGKKYRFRKKRMDAQEKSKVTGKTVPVKINPSDPRQYYIML